MNDKCNTHYERFTYTYEDSDSETSSIDFEDVGDPMFA